MRVCHIGICLVFVSSLLMGFGVFAQDGQDRLENRPKVLLKTSMGRIVLALYPEAAPNTVANFLRYVKEGYYDGTIFHRVIDGFMIQGGGMDAELTEKPTHAPIAHEGRQALAQGLQNKVGAVSMARTNDPHSATAQFFINVKDNLFLDPVPIPDEDPVKEFVHQGQVYNNIARQTLLDAPTLFGYTVFAKVVSGMDVVNRIKLVATRSIGPYPNVPTRPVTILRARVEH